MGRKRPRHCGDFEKATELLHYKMYGRFSGKYPATTCWGWKKCFDDGQLPGVKLIYDEMVRLHIEKAVASDPELTIQFESAIKGGVDFLLTAMAQYQNQEKPFSADQIRVMTEVIKILHGIDIDRQLMKQYQEPKQLELKLNF